MYIPNYKYMFVYIYMIYWNTFLPFFGPWHIAARPAWSPFLVTPQVAGRQICTKVMGVSGWMNVMSEGGGMWGSLA